MHIKIILPGLDDEFKEVIELLQEKEWFDDNGYTLILPEQNEFTPENLEDLTILKELFRKEEFSPPFFEKSKRVISLEVEKINELLKRFTPLQESWGFRIFDTYNLKLTKYGPGGSYNYDTGELLIRVNESGTFDENISHTILHEIIHMGIQENIVNEHNLTHQEKERLVDQLFELLFIDMYPSYIKQDIRDTSIDNFVTKETLLILPESIKRFKVGD